MSPRHGASQLMQSKDYHVFVCWECNARLEEEKPWLYQSEKNTDFNRIHDWSHTLVSVPEELPKLNEPTPSAEEQLALLTTKFEDQCAQIKELRGTVAKLETMLKKFTAKDGDEEGGSAASLDRVE